ncbi:MAG: hemerythrin domain-containing protein [Gammaproteobacteria bacterium]|nr:hemerythrin domain-containing protein [Gammaproteobacteria bacterium]
MHGFIEELQQYHHEKAGHLHALQDYSVRLVEVADTRKDELTELFDPFRGVSETAHHRNEELILLHLRTTDAPIHRKVNEISADHAAFERILSQLMRMIVDESVSHGELSDALQNFVTVYHDHASSEENIFFPIADEYMTERTWRAVRDDWMSGPFERASVR